VVELDWVDCATWHGRLSCGRLVKCLLGIRGYMFCTLPSVRLRLCVSAISNIREGFWPNFSHCCIFQQRWTDLVLGSKGQRSRSHYCGRSIQHSVLPSNSVYGLSLNLKTSKLSAYLVCWKWVANGKSGSSKSMREMCRSVVDKEVELQMK